MIVGEPARAQLSIYRRETIFLAGEHYWESRCSRSQPPAAFHQQVLAYAVGHEELYLYQVRDESTGHALMWQGICGRCLTGTEHADEFTLMDQYLQHRCEPGA